MGEGGISWAGPAARESRGGRYRAGRWDRAVPVPAHVPGVWPKHGLRPRAVSGRARRSPEQAVLGPDQKKWALGRGSGLGLLGHI